MASTRGRYRFTSRSCRVPNRRAHYVLQHVSRFARVTRSQCPVASRPILFSGVAADDEQLSVKSFSLNDLAHRLRHQIAYGLTPRHPPTHLGSRDVHSCDRHRECREPARRQGLVAGSGEYRELRQPRDLRRLAPTVNLPRSIPRRSAGKARRRRSARAARAAYPPCTRAHCGATPDRPPQSDRRPPQRRAASRGAGARACEQRLACAVAPRLVPSRNRSSPSAPKASAAAIRWPWCGGSKVPPKTPIFTPAPAALKARAPAPPRSRGSLAGVARERPAPLPRSRSRIGLH